jgi:hypothetical protein
MVVTLSLPRCIQTKQQLVSYIKLMARVMHHATKHASLRQSGPNLAATTREGYTMKSLIRTVAATTILGLGALTNTASATTILSFGVTGVGNYTVNTGNITAATTSKTLPATELIGGTTTPTAFAAAGLTTGGAATFSQLTFPTIGGPITPFTLSAGTLGLQLTFTNISSVSIVPSGATSNGSISEQFNGNVTGGVGTAAQFVGQTVSISETCTQTSIGASITCSESVLTPGLPVTTPEPSSVALIGIALAGFAALRRRRQGER